MIENLKKDCLGLLTQDPIINGTIGIKASGLGDLSGLELKVALLISLENGP